LRQATEVRAGTVPIYLAGESVEAGTPLEVRNPATGHLVATTFQAGPDELEHPTSSSGQPPRQDARCGNAGSPASSPGARVTAPPSAMSPAVWSPASSDVAASLTMAVPAAARMPGARILA
jgi:hypothetical protein